MNDPYGTVAHSPDDAKSTAVQAALLDHPQQIGRYRIEKVLGEGGFGRVYLAHDDQLKRAVAIKVPRPDRLTRPEDAEEYLAEARTVAGLDHPNIVPIFDVGSTNEFPCYVVSKHIDGTDLATRLKQSRLSMQEAVELLATVGDALHFAHKQGLVHRDIKPGNLLLDKGGKPFVADFGLALREQDVGKGPRYAGTPAYMSPEQARGEGHRVDGRSDIFSMGVVFYELLTGRRPFKADSQQELLEQVTSIEVRPPRQVDDNISKELERICLKALAKRASERYSTAKDMAEDLRHFLASAPIGERSSVNLKPVDEAAVSTPSPTPTTPVSGQTIIKIVPKGLRSFDAGDADFFLELLPGPRDREGLPDSIRFWKTRIEQLDADSAFSVGLIYGPSGCGKSSLMKAALLPRLSDAVIAVYLEATAEETETRLLNGLRKRCPALPASLGLKETLAALRRGQGIPVGKKVLIVLDQFEQWLHAKKDEESTELVQALRQCDGGRVQCIVMVRDDFWLAVSRFLRDLEIRLVDGQNSALVDLFPIRHAEKVLAAFGRAFGVLSDASTDANKDQKQFVEQAVASLAQEGKVVSVRLALFAEMMKGKSWTPATLKEVGGTEGVGVTFLEETFSAATAPPEHRYHQKAARSVLKALLPESGTDIKGHMRTRAELLEASGYTSRPKDFDELLRILDSEIRLITPTDPEGKEGDSASQVQAGAKYYQLTHDYLVPSLRDWLTRKQKETRRGRAELLLADRAAVWNARPENRQLPSLRQLLQIRWWTQKKNWTPPQKKMMAKAARYHAVRGMVVAVALALLGWGSYEGHGTLQAYALRRNLLDANTNEVPNIVADMNSYRRWINPLLHEAYRKAEADKDARKQLHASLALLPVDPGQVAYLHGRMLDAEPFEVSVIRNALAPHKDELLEKLWAVVETPEKGKESQRLRAAAALAKYDPESEKWAKIQVAVVNDLVSVPAVYLASWIDSLRGVRAKLRPELSSIYRDSSRRETERLLATDILADYAADNPRDLADLLMDADEKQFASLYPKVKQQSERGLPVLKAEIDKTPMVAKEKMIFESKGVIAEGDAKVTTNGRPLPAKRFEVRLQIAKTYRITMDSNDLDSFLVIQDKTGKELAFNDDGGGNQNAMLLYTPFGDDTYTVFAAALQEEVGNRQKTGAFVLKITETAGEEDGKEKLAKRQANAAVALLMMNQPEKVWPLLKHSPDPRLRSYLIHRFGPLGADANAIVKRMDAEPDVTIKRALILSLGEFGVGQMPMSERHVLIDKLLRIYEVESDNGLHGAAEWLVRHWGQGAKLKAIDDKLRTNERQLQEALRTNLTEEQKQRLATLAAEVEEIQTRQLASEKELLGRQAAWEKKLREQPVARLASLQEGLIAHYPLDEAEGTETANAVKGQPGATYQGEGKPEWGPGVLGPCLRLDGKSTVVGKRPLELESDQPFSYGCWFQYDARIPMILLSTRDSSKGFRGFDLSLEDDHQLRVQIVGEKQDLPAAERKVWSPFLLSVITTTTVDPRRYPGWHHVMVTYDGSTKGRGVIILVDGKVQKTKILEDNLVGTIKSTVPFHIGSRQHETFRFRGQIDDVRMYNRRLSDKEVQQLFESGTQALVQTSAEKRTPEQQILLATYYRPLDVPLQRLGEQLSAARKSLQEVEANWTRRWYVNTQGQTMVVIPGPVEFVMGSPPLEKDRLEFEPQHKRRIFRTFAIASKSVTNEQYQKFEPGYNVDEKNFHRMADLPVVGIDWYRAAKYCNWLSKEEGIAEDQWCYEIKGNEMKLKANYLSLSGYRLPTEAEMEYATRAGGLTSRYFGETEDLLPKYAYYKKNSKGMPWPVGSLKPNDLGLFDVQGNVDTWCQERIDRYPTTNGEEAVEDKEGDTVISPTQFVALRGGSFNDEASRVRSSTRMPAARELRAEATGFRPSRTLPLGSLVAGTQLLKPDDTVNSYQEQDQSSNATLRSAGDADPARIRRVTPAERATVQSPGSRPVSGRRKSVR